MSAIQLAELSSSESQLSPLSDRATTEIVGGYGDSFRNSLINQISTAVQINNNVNVQIAFGGDNFNSANLGNFAGVGQAA